MGKVEETTLGAYCCTEIYSNIDAAIIKKSNWRSRYLNQIGILKTFRLFNPDGSEITSISPYFYFSDIFLENHWYLRSSRIIDLKNDGNTVIITTQNSRYTFQKGA